MGDEKIFKDLTKKYAELAKKIHSKDRRSMSLIKDCSKRIALLDKLRVLEGSYLKCLKNKVKRGQKGGVTGDDEEEEANQQQAAGIINKALDEADTTNDNKERALAICTTALVKTIELKERARKFIEERKGEILEAYNNTNLSENEKLAFLSNQGLKLAKLASATLKENTGMDADKALETAYNKGIILKEGFDTIVFPVLKESAKGVYNSSKNIGISAYNAFKRKIASASTTQTNPSGTGSTGSTGGSKKTTYKLNGEKVVLLHKNKKVQRSIYVKGNGKTKYCKIDHQYILLSKLKNKIQ